MKRIKGILGILLAGMIIISCGDSDPVDVNVKLQMNVGDEALVQETVYQVNEVDVKFTNVAFYLGDMTFKTSNDKSFESNSRYYLVKEGVLDFDFSLTAEEGEEGVNLTDIDFIVGVDATTNAETEMDFTERAVDDPLGQQNPTMHWGWAGGYRFMNIDAEADLDGDGEFETQLTYHLGKNEFLKNINLKPNVKLEQGANNFQVIFDLSKFLSGLDFETENFTKAQPDNITIADKLLTNYESAFSFVE